MGWETCGDVIVAAVGFVAVNHAATTAAGGLLPYGLGTNKHIVAGARLYH